MGHLTRNEVRNEFAATTVQGALVGRRESQKLHLEKELLHNHDASIIQSGLQRWKEYELFKRKGPAANTIKAFSIGFSARAPIREMRRKVYGPAAQRINGLVRGKDVRNHYDKIDREAEFLQKLILTTLARRAVISKVEDYHFASAVTIQGHLIGAQTRGHYKAVNETAQIVQSGVTGYQARKDVAALRAEATGKAAARIQGQIAGYETRMQFLEVNDAVKKIQGLLVAGNSRREFKVKENEHLQASQIQGIMVGKKARLGVEQEHMARLESAMEQAPDGMVPRVLRAGYLQGEVHPVMLLVITILTPQTQNAGGCIRSGIFT